MKPMQFFVEAFRRVQKFSDRGWYPILIGVFAGLDSFVFIIPTEALMVPYVVLRPKSWMSAAAWISAGSAIGALALAFLARERGLELVVKLLGHEYHSPTWDRSVHFVEAHGALAIFLTSLSPIPQQPAVAFAGLAHLSIALIFFAVLGARLLKYGFVAWMASRAPRLFKKQRSAI